MKTCNLRTNKSFITLGPGVSLWHFCFPCGLANMLMTLFWNRSVMFYYNCWETTFVTLYIPTKMNSYISPCSPAHQLLFSDASKMFHTGLLKHFKFEPLSYHRALQLIQIRFSTTYWSWQGVDHVRLVYIKLPKSYIFLWVDRFRCIPTHLNAKFFR
jgi:hypothetical protein